MPFQPEFMIKTEEYEKEKSKIVSGDDWRKFKFKWFNESTWPKKTLEQREIESINNREAKIIKGRKWGHVFYPYDITSEARYEMFVTLYEIGFPLVFLNGIQKPNNINNNQGWNQDCPYDEISTMEIGDKICPICGRRMIYVWTGD